MTTLTNRIPKGVPAGGQFSADLRGEPTTTLDAGASEVSDPQVLRNLNRAIRPTAEITEAQKERLRSRKTPLLNTFKRKGFTLFAPAATRPATTEKA